jgi:hypothetical protein
MIDFTDKDQQIELNEKRLSEEYERYREIKSRIGILLVIYTIFSAYSLQLIKLFMTTDGIVLLYSLSLVLFIFFFVISIICAILLSVPSGIAYKELPKVFYDEVFKEYSNNDRIEKEAIKYYIRETYAKQTEDSVEHVYKLNNKKSKYHYYAYIFALIALIPYIVCVGFTLFVDTNGIQKVQLTNSYFDLNEKEFKMADKEDSQPQEKLTVNTEVKPSLAIQGNTPKDTVINPELVIVRQPVIIKENKSTPEPVKQSEKTEKE